MLGERVGKRLDVNEGEMLGAKLRVGTTLGEPVGAELKDGEKLGEKVGIRLELGIKLVRSSTNKLPLVSSPSVTSMVIVFGSPPSLSTTSA